MTDKLFEAMAKFAREDVHRAKNDGQSKPEWRDVLIQQGRKIAESFGLKSEGYDVEYKAIRIAQWTWINVETQTDRDAAAKKQVKQSQKYARKPHAKDAAKRYSHFRSL